MKDEIIFRLTLKDDSSAWAFANKIIAESQEADEWYEYFDLLEIGRSIVSLQTRDGTRKINWTGSCLDSLPM